MTKHYQNFRLDEQTDADILAMAEHVGKPGNRTAGLCAVFAEWRRLKAAEAARQERAVQAVTRIAEHEDQRDAVAERLARYEDRAAQIARQEEFLDALDRRAEA